MPALLPARLGTWPRPPVAVAVAVAVTVALTLLLSGCGGGGGSRGGGYLAGDRPPDRDVDVSHIPDAVPRPEARSRYGNPESYDVLGKRYYVMASSHGYVERGTASWYGKKFHGRLTSNREPYDMFAMTAAHKTLPLPTYVRVTNLDNGRAVVVRVNDRGPFHDGRIIDLSYAAAKKLGILAKGTGHVEVRALDPNRPDPAPATVTARRETTLARPAPTPIPAAEPAAPPVAVAATDPAAAFGKVYLQLGAFNSQTNAERLVARLQAAQFDGAQVIPGASADGPIYRVRLGPLPSTADADTLTTQLNALGIGSPHVIID